MVQEANAGKGGGLSILKSHTKGFTAFLYKTLPHLLAVGQIYSPLNTYIVLALLAELTAGESRGQILSLLKIEDIESLRVETASLWKKNIWEDGSGISLLANSLWLCQEIYCNPAILSTLENFYNAAIYQGVMGSPEFCKKQKQWIDTNTRHLLSKQTEYVSFERDTILGVISAISFRACWMEPFEKGKNTREVFHGSEGDIICEFMHERARKNYYWGKGYVAIQRFFEEGSAMWLVLPEKGYRPEELLGNSQVTEMVLEEENWKNQKEAWVSLSLPKFCVSSKIDFCKVWWDLGITNIFDESRSDFRCLANGNNVVVSRVLHVASVAIDEQGCEAAAFSAVSMEVGAVLPEKLEKVDIILDRPFLFFIISPFEQILFAGIVTKP